MKKLVDQAYIVDDDNVYTYTLERMFALKNWSTSIHVFNDSRQALHSLVDALKAQRSVPEVVLLDINMPVLDGWQFLDSLQKEAGHLAKQLTVYMVSSSVDMGDITKAKEYSLVKDYFVKPVDYNTLAELFESEVANG